MPLCLKETEISPSYNGEVNAAVYWICAGQMRSLCFAIVCDLMITTEVNKGLWNGLRPIR